MHVQFMSQSIDTEGSSIRTAIKELILEKTYKNVIYVKAFAQQVVLDHHRRTHTREMPYRCCLGHKRFAHNGALKERKYIGK